MANGYSIFIGLILVAIFCAVSWIFAPKGENQLVWRSTLVLSAVACYIMWAITFLAQWHPIISPINKELRGPHASGQQI